MEPIDLRFLESPGVCIKGEIYGEMHPDVLLQDLIEVELPSGEIIDVGWYPEHDLHGSFRVSRYDYSDTLQQQYAPTAMGALAIVKCLVDESLQSSALSYSSYSDLELAHA